MLATVFCLNSCQKNADGDVSVTPIGWIIIVAAVLLIWYLINYIQKRDEEEEEEEEFKEHLYSNYISCGTYVGGHPSLNESVEDVFCQAKDNKLVFSYSEIKDLTIPRVIKDSEIPIGCILNITIEDASTIEKRVSLGRLLLVGVYALFWQKNVKKESAFLVIEWKDGRFEHSTTFLFQGDNAFQQANTTRNKLISICK